MTTCQACHLSSYNYSSKEKKVTYHRFPTDASVCKKWLEFCKNDALKSLPVDTLKRRWICSRHFDRTDYMSPSSNRLKPYAVPTKEGPPSSDKLPLLDLDDIWMSPSFQNIQLEEKDLLTMVAFEELFNLDVDSLLREG
ncbi:THAP domain-containing protein 6 isoform X2 [Anabrus simplex]|uniref:THAP domain-containing protein 6 isoform X2 n=1 Tax=Anabrus simplex TaxID=316456 RepID=UPI0034DD7282